MEQTLKPLAEERLRAFKAKAEELRSDRRSKEERHAELSTLDPAEAVLDLKVLDPAMGSGHFLVTTVDFLSDYIAELVESVPTVPGWLDGEYRSPLTDRVAAIRQNLLERAGESHWVVDEGMLTDQAIIRRMVLKRCIYGVDKNPLTVELAKVSLWLHSFHRWRSPFLPGPPPPLRGLSGGPADSGRRFGSKPAGRALRGGSHRRGGGRGRRDAANRGHVGRRHCGGQGIRGAVSRRGKRDVRTWARYSTSSPGCAG